MNLLQIRSYGSENVKFNIFWHLYCIFYCIVTLFIRSKEAVNRKFKGIVNWFRQRVHELEE